MRLEITGLCSGYHGGRVLDRLDLDLPEGTALGITGRNGAGKSTLVNTIAGLIRPQAGRIRIDGRELGKARPDVIARAGVGLVPQGRRVFAPLTIEEHLRIAVRPGPWPTNRVYALFPALERRRAVRAGRLSGGEQQMLAIARALVTGPRVLLLDEPSDGLAAMVRGHVERVIADLTAEGVTILLVEQASRLPSHLVAQTVTLDNGRLR